MKFKKINKINKKFRKKTYKMTANNNNTLINKNKKKINLML